MLSAGDQLNAVQWAALRRFRGGPKIAQKAGMFASQKDWRSAEIIFRRQPVSY
ncbi:hypothetical protein FC91_GL002489 [Schleiferilactobacillus harbinensis DSM 16991]|uniref:Uncharacterized protein n=1 Tax=Schleiferilactobacillus harbinensis DSM 16991 TaxID=1122147 RepID=A0A0R1XCT4_9LACO|nr:hypothetical protein FC91_GL002489 [Schleiferilactobacillus harbinensis DSM 16991]